MDRHDAPRHEVSVSDVRDFTCPSEGQWPCIACGEPFAVRNSWQIFLEEAGAVVTCGRCADHARRNGSISLPTDHMINLDDVTVTGAASQTPFA